MQLENPLDSRVRAHRHDRAQTNEQTAPRRQVARHGQQREREERGVRIGRNPPAGRGGGERQRTQCRVRVHAVARLNQRREMRGNHAAHRPADNVQQDGRRRRVRMIGRTGFFCTCGGIATCPAAMVAAIVAIIGSGQCNRPRGRGRAANGCVLVANQWRKKADVGEQLQLVCVSNGITLNAEKQISNEDPCGAGRIRPTSTAHAPSAIERVVARFEYASVLCPNPRESDHTI
jgi:hypothetical protein